MAIFLFIIALLAISLLWLGLYLLGNFFARLCSIANLDEHEDHDLE